MREAGEGGGTKRKWGLWDQKTASRVRRKSGKKGETAGRRACTSRKGKKKREMNLNLMLEYPERLGAKGMRQCEEMEGRERKKEKETEER